MPRPQLLHQVNLVTRKSGFDSGRADIPMYLGTPVFPNASPYTWVAQYIGMHPYILGYPSICECIPIYWGSLVCGKHPHVLGYPIPLYANVSTYSGVAQHM
jgi:hypothetical protein